MLGDCLERMSVIPFEPMWRELKRVIRPRGAIVLFGSQPFTSALVMSNVKWFKYEWVWDKVQATGFLNALRQPLKTTESVLVFCDGQSTYYPQMGVGAARKRTSGTMPTSANYGQHIRVGRPSDNTRYPTNLVCFSQGRSPNARTVHPTQKPLALLEYLVRTYTNEGDTVLDFVAGSGTTGEACITTGRTFIGIEKEAQYYTIATNRLAAAAARMVQMELAV